MANSNGAITGKEVLNGVKEEISKAHDELKLFIASYDKLRATAQGFTTKTGGNNIIQQNNTESEKAIVIQTKLATLEKKRQDAIIARAKAEVAANNEAFTSLQKKANAEKAVTLAKSAKLNLDKKEQGVAAKTSSYYKQQSAELNKLRDTYKSLELKKIKGIALSKQEERQYIGLRAKVLALNSALTKSDAAAGQFQRNVGNYTGGIKSAVTSLRSLAGAFGLFSGVYLFANILRDSFNRVKEFDGSMQTLAGVLQTTRTDLGELEQKIIDVASELPRTSNEIAKLAETLATLGKSKEDIANLLEPVSQLSIALKATSDESGEFLVQMLNAFERPSSAAEEFANVIASIRNSTTLDFQKMRDSFQYIAPISNLLGKDLAYTGAVVGILADNSLKAESAGRILATAQIKLAKEGKTLQEGLDEINDAYERGATEIELLAIAGKSFGAQGAKIGAILAKNNDKIEINTQKIRENRGALNDLVTQEMESLGNKLALLDSAWESLILTIENGNGKLSNAFKFMTEVITHNLQQLTEYNKTAQEKGSETAKRIVKDFENSTRASTQTTKQFLVESIQATDDAVSAQIANLKKIDKESLNIFQNDKGEFTTTGFATPGDLALLNETNEELEKQKAIRAELTKQLKEYKEVQSGGSGSGGGSDEEISDARTLAVVNKELSAARKELSNSTASESGVIKKRIVALQEEAKQWEINNTIIEKNREKLEKVIDVFTRDFEQAEIANEAFKKVLGDISKIEVDGSWIDDLIEKQKELNEEMAKMPKNTEKSAEELKGIFNGLFSTFTSYYDLDLAAFNDLIDQKSAKDIDYASTAKSIAGAITDTKLIKYDLESKKNQETLDLILNDTNASDKKKEQAQIEYDKKEAALELKKAKAKRDAILVQIAIDGAAAFVKSLPNFALGAAALAAAGLQATFVSSQPLPQFFKGKPLGDNYEGWGTWGERGREIGIDKKGNIEVSPNKTTPRYIDKDLLIVPSFSNFQEQIQLPNSDVSKRLGSKLKRDTAANMQMFSVSNDTNTKEVERLLKKLLQKENGTPKIHNHIVLTDKRVSYHG